MTSCERVVYFILGIILVIFFTNTIVGFVLGLILITGSVFNDTSSSNYSSNYSSNSYIPTSSFYEESEARRIKDLESQDRFKKQNQYWMDKHNKDDQEFHTFEVHYMTYNYANVIKEIVLGNNISEVQRKFQADPKVKRLITVR